MLQWILLPNLKKKKKKKKKKREFLIPKPKFFSAHDAPTKALLDGGCDQTCSWH
jgi:hypothetical protein